MNLRIHSIKISFLFYFALYKNTKIFYLYSKKQKEMFI